MYPYTQTQHADIHENTPYLSLSLPLSTLIQARAHTQVGSSRRHLVWLGKDDGVYHIINIDSNCESTEERTRREGGSQKGIESEREKERKTKERTARWGSERSRGRKEQGAKENNEERGCGEGGGGGVS